MKINITKTKTKLPPRISNDKETTVKYISIN